MHFDLLDATFFVNMETCNFIKCKHLFFFFAVSLHYYKYKKDPYLVCLYFSVAA